MSIPRLLASIVLLSAVSASAVPASASSTHIVGIVIENNSDTWAWITVYSGARRGQMASGCVNPKSSRTFDVNTETYQPASPINLPYEIRAEITHTGCSHPVYVDSTLGWARGGPYYVRGNAGHYSFWHTP